MKRTLRATAALLGLGLAAVPAAAPAAHAQMPVTDGASIAARAIEAGKSLTQLVQQWETMKQQYAGIMQTVGALSHPRQVLQNVPGLLQQQIQNPGSGAASIPGLGFGSQLSAGAQRYLGQNRYYAPRGDDFQAQEMQRRARATANLQAEAQAGMDRADERIAYLNQLQQSVEEQPDVTAVAAVEAQVGNQRNFLANEGNNVQRLQLMAHMADRVDQQRAVEHDRQSAEDWTQQSAAAAAAAGLDQ